MLLEDIQSHIKEALKSGDSERAGILRMLVSQIKNKEIEKRAAQADLTDEDVMDVLRKEIKKRRESADLFRQGGREDLAQNEEKEIVVIQTYLPAAPTEEDVRRVVAEIKAAGTTEFPLVMKEAMARLKGADGALVSKIAKE